MADDINQTNPSRARLILAIVVIAVIASALVIAFALSQSRSPAGSVITAESYADEVAAAMSGADADMGAALINEHDCFTCHVLGDGSLSPLFDGIGLLAPDRRPPLDAAAYLYEAIVLPGAFILEGYSDSMPNTYTDSLTSAQIGHIIAYLLTLTEPPPDF